MTLERINVPNHIEKSQNTIVNPLRELVIEKIHSKEYTSLMDPIVQRIDKDQVGSINESFLLWNDYRVGYQETVSLLANILDIEPRVDIHIIPESERKKYPIARCGDEGGTIRIFHVKNDSYHGTGKIIDPIRKIAHEMWHVYQYNEIRKGGPKSAVYQDNLSDYYRIGQEVTLEEQTTYFRQPIEEEAIVFGEKFTIEFIKKLIDSLNDELNDERNSLIGKTAISSAIANTQNDEDEDFFATETEMKTKQLERIKKLYARIKDYYNLDK